MKAVLAFGDSNTWGLIPGSASKERYPLDAAVVMLGTNDCKPVYGASAYTIGKGLEACLEEMEHYESIIIWVYRSIKITIFT